MVISKNWLIERYDRNRKWFFTIPLLLKGVQRYFPTNSELFWDVKWKMEILGEKQKHKKEPK